MFKNVPKYSWLSFVPFTLLSVLAVVLLSLGVINPHYLWGTFVMWILVSGLGIAAGYHRVFSHRTHNLPMWKENIVLFFGALGGQGSSITWTAIHRGYHHAHSDTKRDLHSPIAYSAWHSFFGWTLAITENSNVINMKYAVDLMRKKNHLWFHKWQLYILWTVPLVVALFDWRASLACFCLSTGLCLLQDNLVNVLGHRKGIIGYRLFETKDNSQNNLLLGWFGFGQGWHNSHHYDPTQFIIWAKWWEVDPCVIFLPFLGRPTKPHHRIQ